MTRLKLLALARLSFNLEVRDGLLVRSGRGKEMMGGVDIQPVSLEYPYTIDGRSYKITVPYIPGSSLKGRARALLEITLGLPLMTTDTEGKIYMHMKVVRNTIEDEDPYCPVDAVFGTASIQPNKLPEEKKWHLDCWAPTRAIFTDLVPSEKYVKSLCDEKGSCDAVSFFDFLEEKWENRIDRVTSAADPRNALRVKPGVEFRGGVTFLIFDLDVCTRDVCDQHSKLVEQIKQHGTPALYYLTYLLNALQLVEETYLGASGTRGYGKVKFKDLELVLLDASTLNVIDSPLNGKTLQELRGKLDHLRGVVSERLRPKC